MTKTLTVLLVVVCTAIASCASRGVMVAGQATAPYGATVVTPLGGTVPAGTVLWLRLAHTVSADHARVGDTFTADVIENVVSPSGELLVPRGGRVWGRVADLRRSSGHGEPALIVLAVESIELVAGVHQPLLATILETEVPGRRAGPRARDVGLGAALGAVLGAMVEGAEGAVVGGILGAGLGTAISLGTGDVRPELPPGTRLAVRLEGAIRSYASITEHRFH